jgi:predicted RNase H-like HicB family nuclease
MSEEPDLDLDEKVSAILRKPYGRIIEPEEDGTFSARIAEFPGCFSWGESVSEAYASIEQAAWGWLRAAIRQGMSIEEPRHLPDRAKAET